jgi:hypothetical protein
MSSEVTGEVGSDEHVAPIDLGQIDRLLQSIEVHAADLQHREPNALEAGRIRGDG